MTSVEAITTRAETPRAHRIRVMGRDTRYTLIQTEYEGHHRWNLRSDDGYVLGGAGWPDIESAVQDLETRLKGSNVELLIDGNGPELKLLWS